MYDLWGSLSYFRFDHDVVITYQGYIFMTSHNLPSQLNYN